MWRAVISLMMVVVIAFVVLCKMATAARGIAAAVRAMYSRRLFFHALFFSVQVCFFFNGILPDDDGWRCVRSALFVCLFASRRPFSITWIFVAGPVSRRRCGPLCARSLLHNTCFARLPSKDRDHTAPHDSRRPDSLIDV